MVFPPWTGFINMRDEWYTAMAMTILWSKMIVGLSVEILTCFKESTWVICWNLKWSKILFTLICSSLCSLDPNLQLILPSSPDNFLIFPCNPAFFSRTEANILMCHETVGWQLIGCLIVVTSHSKTGELASSAQLANFYHVVLTVQWSCPLVCKRPPWNQRDILRWHLAAKHGTVASTHLSIPGFHLSGIPKIQNIRGLLTGYVLGGGFNPVEI